ncbi:MAG TPA: hypothetical protein VHX16_11120 [Chloroflexota bacterium]|jgi:hypothetical protein|nr:hypothetical protein [Chloroflexota bacterium]
MPQGVTEPADFELCLEFWVGGELVRAAEDQQKVGSIRCAVLNCSLISLAARAASKALLGELPVPSVPPVIKL